MPYTTLLLDLDHTLLDSDASEVAAFADTVRSVGYEPTEALFSRYKTINGALWTAVERGETTPQELRLTRFEQFIAELDRGMASGQSQSPVGGARPDAETMASTFSAGLGKHGELYPGACEVLDALAETARLAMVTNGLSEVQRARIERLDLGRYFDSVVISAEVGTAKPGTDIFDLVFEQLGEPDRNGCLMIGDSLTSDIQGGTNYGIDTCWYNPNGKSRSAVPSAVVTHEIADLKQLPGVVSAAGRSTKQPIEPL